MPWADAIDTLADAQYPRRLLTRSREGALALIYECDGMGSL